MPALRQTPRVDQTLITALADDLRACGYTTERVRSLWSHRADAALGRGHAAAARRVLGAAEGSLAVVARLFGLGDTVSTADLDDALPGVGSIGLEQLGLITISGGAARPAVLIRPHAFVDEAGFVHWWIASDLDEAALGTALGEDHVLGVGGASLTLVGLQFATPVGRVLDLGAGCGIQTLRAAREAKTIVATDISERALAFTRFNAALNAPSLSEARVDAVYSDLFAQLAGERFDRVVSNPPFVITPRVDGVPAYEYRDGGLVGDGIVEAVVRGVGAHLEPGGTAHLLGNWEYRADEDGLDRVRQWVSESETPLDAWVIERERLDPVAYAELWIRDGGTVPGTPEFDRLLGAWLDDFDARGVTEIGFGYILLRRPVAGGVSLARFERVTHAINESGVGAAWERALEAHDVLETRSDDELLASTLLVAPDVTEARHFLPGSDDPSIIELRQGGGFARTIQVDPAVAALVGASDGDLTLGQIVGALAELFEVDAHALAADLLPRVRALVIDGMLRLA